MRPHLIGLLAAGIILASATLPAGEPPSVGELTKELTGEKPAAERTPEQLEAVYAQVLDALMPEMGNEDPGKRGGPQATLEKIAFRAGRPGAEAERAACSKAIAARLSPDVGPLGRVWLLRQLERIGRAEAVPQVAKLLADKDPLVRESARRALQKNPAPEAGAALREALGSADTPGWRVALINALGERREEVNLSALAQATYADSDDVRTAAAIALAKLGDKALVGAILNAMTQGSPRAKQAANDCYLRVADALAAKGDKAQALPMYKRMLGADGELKHLKCAALIGIGRAGSAAELDTLLDALADPDARVRGACVEALALLPGRAVTDAIIAKLKTPRPETRLALLQALARRGDDNAVDSFMIAAEDADEGVRAAALAGLATVDDLLAVPVLLKAAASTGNPQEVARQSLQSMRAGCLDNFLTDSINEKDPKIRVEVARALAARHVVAATAALLKSAADADAGVRTESLKALGVVAPSDALAPLTALLVATQDDGFRTEAGNALVLIANRDADLETRSAPVLKALAGADGPARLALLSVLGRIGGQKSLDAVRAVVEQGDEKVRDAAIRALAEWPDATAADDLLRIAKSAAGQTHQVLAIRGYIRVCRIKTNRPDAETAKMLAAGLDAARRPDEKKQALAGLGEVRDILALQAAAPCMDDDALKEEAVAAAVRIARDVWSRHPEAVQAAMRRALEVTKRDNLRRDAQEALDRTTEKLKQAKPKK